MSVCNSEIGGIIPSGDDALIGRGKIGKAKIGSKEVKTDGLYTDNME